MSLTAPLDTFSGLIGRGLFAGLAGTAAVSMVQAAERILTGHRPGTTPAEAVERIFGLRALDDECKIQLAKIVHWGYGICWGLFRSLLAVMGWYGFSASLVHWIAVWGTALVLLPQAKVAPPAREWSIPRHVAESVLHFVYAAAAGIMYDLMR